MKLLLQMLALFFIFQTTCFVACKEPIECKINDQDPSKVFYTIVVSQSGGGKFSTVKQAIDSIPLENDKWVKIALRPGTYTEQVKIMEKQCIVLEGQDRSTTIIQFDAHSDTEKSVTFDVFAHNFVARGITFKACLFMYCVFELISAPPSLFLFSKFHGTLSHDGLYREMSHTLISRLLNLKGKCVNTYNLPDDATSKKIAPAVAFRSYGDKQAFFNCGFEGYQDTLWDCLGRHYYDSCYIEGAIDFIWGKGASIFQKCSINVTGDGYITAQGKSTSDQLSGFVFNRCIVSGQGQALLGRAYDAFASVIFMNSYFGDVIKPEGWDLWKQTGYKQDVTFAEYNCKGPGADTSKRVPWSKTVSASGVRAYSTKAFIDKDGWIEKLP
ncbi:hypothetical protein Cgig2_012123 [Carnegiea gigantea]|uniref:pectinesterase n=1 Tax=Carnegiea gigantea TaxID=171969 RepID=A0A9Q1KT91_9CARY|nr:hypothetical protein Cgig2_012123 [Carnegiea gigantea]